jgi:hypothetical protein
MPGLDAYAGYYFRLPRRPRFLKGFNKIDHRRRVLNIQDAGAGRLPTSVVEAMISCGASSPAASSLRPSVEWPRWNLDGYQLCEIAHRAVPTLPTTMLAPACASSGHVFGQHALQNAVGNFSFVACPPTE